jgi:hypothetical protein
VPRIKPDDYLDDSYDSEEEFLIGDDLPTNRRGQVIVPKNPERREPDWDENRRQLQRKYRRDFD